jgi:gliding motility-associated-like protein
MCYLQFRVCLIIYFCLFYILTSSAATPGNDNITDAKAIVNISSYCSDQDQFSNVGATKSNVREALFWKTEGKDIWYKFTAVNTDLRLSMIGQAIGNTNTMISPLAALYIYEDKRLAEQVGSMTTNDNITNYYKGGLTVGQEYYIRLSAEDDNEGSFQFCINNYSPPKNPGQDFSGAAILCSKDTFTEFAVAGAGNNNHESVGSCLGTESNSAWYTFEASNNGTLTFSITPSANNDDVDWVLYDLGLSGALVNLIPENIIRCAAGSGTNCTPKYYITGLNSTSLDLSEQSGCVTGQDGWLKYVDLVAGHHYALLVDNFSNGNNGFTIEFGGTGEFVGPKAKISMTPDNLCMLTQSFTFTAIETSGNSLRWSFGTDASIPNSSLPGPHTISYSTPGIKTVVLESIGARGCTAIDSYSFAVDLKPPTPVISFNKLNFCLNETLELSVPSIKDATYLWTGPADFTATTSNISVLLTSLQQAGDYSVIVFAGTCASDAASINIPSIVNTPVALFTTNLTLPGKHSVPIDIQFINQSKNADSFLWDFGDGKTSIMENPIHSYKQSGEYNVRLSANTVNGCTDVFEITNVVLVDEVSSQIPNSFSPNGDGINDLFNVNITNLKAYQLMIFNRYGVKIFIAKESFSSWDGTWQNQQLPVGVYYYQIIATDLSNKKITRSGSVTLIR